MLTEYVNGSTLWRLMQLRPHGHVPEAWVSARARTSRRFSPLARGAVLLSPPPALALLTSGTERRTPAFADALLCDRARARARACARELPHPPARSSRERHRRDQWPSAPDQLQLGFARAVRRAGRRAQDSRAVRCTRDARRGRLRRVGRLVGSRMHAAPDVRRPLCALLSAPNSRALLRARALRSRRLPPSPTAAQLPRHPPRLAARQLFRRPKSPLPSPPSPPSPPPVSTTQQLPRRQPPPACRPTPRSARAPKGGRTRRSILSPPRPPRSSSDCSSGTRSSYGVEHVGTRPRLRLR